MTDSDSTWDPTAVFVGTGADAGLAILAAGVALPTSARWPAFAGVLAGGLLGGYLSGRLAGGPWRRRMRHGLLAGLLGGAAFAAAVWWSLFPVAPNGALRPANYLLANAAAWFPPGFTARYDAYIAAATALAFGALYVAEGAVAAGAAPSDAADAVEEFGPS